MRKIALFLSLLLLTVNIYAQQGTRLSSGKASKPQVELVTSNDNQIVVNFHLNGFNTTKVETPRGIQNIVNVPEMVSMLQAGAPDLPQFAIPAIIGDRAEMQVSVTKSKFVDFDNVEVAPSKGNFSRQTDPNDVPYTYGEAYSTNAFFPNAQATLDVPYIIRDFRGQNIMVKPFAYNPITKTLRVYTDLTIEMRKVSDNGENQKMRGREARKMSPETKAEYSSRFINYNEMAAKYPFVEDRGEMLIICPDQYMTAMQPLVDWKNISGRPTTMVSLATAGGNNDTNIKNYIQNIYNDQNRNLKYVLFVGDYSDLTPHSFSQGSYSGRSDIWFGQLEGNDLYPELLVGRFSVGSVNDVNTHVNKVLYYEREMPAGLTWLNKGIGIGANEGNGNGHNGGEADYVHINYIRDTLLHYTYASVSQQYSGVGSGTSASSISNDVNNGASIINYCNHGSVDSWAVAGYSNSDVNALTNDYKWPYIISVACLNGQFNSNCFGEAWLRATNNSTGVPTGAVGGMFSWISQPWTPPMTGQDKMIGIITEWTNTDKYNHTMGGAFINGSTGILDNHNDDSGKGTELSWLLFGEPTLMLRTDNPVDMNVTYSPGTLMLGMNSLTVNAQTDFGIATLSMNGEVLGSAYIENGQANITFNSLSNVGTAKLVVIGYNKVTYEADIEVVPAEGPYLSVSDYAPKFAHVGDQADLSIDITNVGVETLAGPTIVTLSSNDSLSISFGNATSTLGTIEPNATSTVSGFTFTIAPYVADGTVIPVNVTMTNGQETWGGTINITAGKAILEFDGFSWKGSFTPGETFNVIAKFKNTGHYQSENAIATISSENQYITFNNPEVNYGTIAVDGTASCVFSVTISPDCPSTETIPLTFTMIDAEENQAEGDGELTNSCDIVFNLMDSYGDGWNNAYLTIAFSDGTASQTLNFACSGWSGCNTKEYTLTVNSGTEITVTFHSGNYDDEISYTIYYADDETNIIQDVSTPSTTPFTFTVNCGGGEAIDILPVLNLAATIENNNDVVLTWDAPTRATLIGYTVYRTDLSEPLGTTQETTFTDADLEPGTYYYIVEANYEEGDIMSNPVSATIIDDGIGENTANVTLFPNPAKETLHIVGKQITEVSMFNIYGQEVIRTTAGHDNIELNVSGLATGVYVVKTITKSGSNIQSIIVK